MLVLVWPQQHTCKESQNAVSVLNMLLWRQCVHILLLSWQSVFFCFWQSLLILLVSDPVLILFISWQSVFSALLLVELAFGSRLASPSFLVLIAICQCPVSQAKCDSEVCYWMCWNNISFFTGDHLYGSQSSSPQIFNKDNTIDIRENTFKSTFNRLAQNRKSISFFKV